MTKRTSNLWVSIPFLLLFVGLWWLAFYYKFIQEEIAYTLLFLVFLLWACFFTKTNNYNESAILKDSVFVQVVLGFEHKKPQEVAHHWVLLLGLSLEWIILYSTFSEILLVDGSDDSLAAFLNKALLLAIVPIISSLMLHQILIFRNFTVAESREEEINSKFLWLITFFIFIGIGAVAGEIGYIFAISKLSDIGTNGGITWFIMDAMQTTPEHLYESCRKASSDESRHLCSLKNYETASLKQSLKGIFVIGAIVVCTLVIFWDVLIWFYMREKFRVLIYYFIIMDISSLGIWVILSRFIVPAFYVENIDKLKLLLVAVVILYILVTIARLIYIYYKLSTENKHTTDIAL
jgi:hypothetical protein